MNCKPEPSLVSWALAYAGICSLPRNSPKAVRPAFPWAMSASSSLARVYQQ